MSVGIKITSGPVLDKPGDLAGLLTNLETGDILFIDEIHRLSPLVEEYLYSAMEDFKIDIMLESALMPVRYKYRLIHLRWWGYHPLRSAHSTIKSPLWH